MNFHHQDDDYNYYEIVGMDFLCAKKLYIPFDGCTANMISIVKEKYESDFKMKVIADQTGLSNYKIKKIINFIENGQPNDPVLYIVRY